MSEHPGDTRVRRPGSTARSARLALVLLVLALLLAACGETSPDGQPTAPPAGAGTPAAGGGEVSMEAASFVPAELTVSAGSEVRFSNTDSLIHTVTSDTGLFDSGSLSPGDAFAFTFDDPGEYPYHCVFHGAPGGVGMAGTIIVVP